MSCRKDQENLKVGSRQDLVPSLSFRNKALATADKLYAETDSLLALSNLAYFVPIILCTIASLFKSSVQDAVLTSRYSNFNSFR